MRSLVFPAGVGIKNKTSVKQRLNHAVYRVVDYPVPERRGFDMPLFGIVHRELAIPAMLVRLRPQFVLQAQKVILQIIAKIQHLPPVPFAADRRAVPPMEILE